MHEDKLESKNISMTKKVAVVIPCFNEAESIDELFKQLDSNFLVEDPQCTYSFILVDDGSVDETWYKISKFSNNQNSRVYGLKLSRNFGHQKALLAGLEYALKSADFIITMDADLQHPIKDARKMLLLAINRRYNIVLGQRKLDEYSSFFKKSTSKSFYKLMNYFGVDIVPNVSDFRVMDKASTEALIDHGDTTFFTRGIISLIGFSQYIYAYNVEKRFAGESKYSTRKMIKFASEGITSLSISPLRLTFLASLVMFGICGAVLIYVIGSWFSGNIASGWSSIILSIYILFGFNFLLIGILGEYIGKIYQQSLRRPRYIIQEMSIPSTE